MSDPRQLHNGAPASPSLADVSPPVSAALDDVLSQSVSYPSYRIYRERRRRRMQMLCSLAGAYLTAAFAVGLFTSYGRFGLTRTEGSWASVGVLVIGAVVGIYTYTRKRKESDDRRPGGAPTLNSSGNEVLIANYHQLTVRQSASSFRNSQIAMGLGLLILASGGLTVITADEDVSRLILGALTAMGSAFSGYLSATFLRAHDRALQQVNYLFSQPLVSHYLEYGRTVALELSTPALKDKALTNVIDRSLRSAGVAVMTRAPDLPKARLPRRSRTATRETAVQGANVSPPPAK